MRVAFHVTPDSGVLIDQSYIGFSFGGPDSEGRMHSLDLIRAPGFSPDEVDWGPYLEFDGLENREFEIIACRLSRERLSLDLSRPFAGQPNGPVGFELSLTGLSDERYRELARWLPLALRGFTERLQIVERIATPDRPRE